MWRIEGLVDSNNERTTTLNKLLCDIVCLAISCMAVYQLNTVEVAWFEHIPTTGLTGICYTHLRTRLLRTEAEVSEKNIMIKRSTYE